MTAAETPHPKLIPELNVSDLAASLRFWRDILQFEILYDRPEEGFARIVRDGAEFMLETHGAGPAERARIWDTGPLERPFGRGINFQISVSDIDVRWKRRVGRSFLVRKNAGTGSAPRKPAPGNS